MPLTTPPPPPNIQYCIVKDMLFFLPLPRKNEIPERTVKKEYFEELNVYTFSVVSRKLHIITTNGANSNRYKFKYRRFTTMAAVLSRLFITVRALNCRTVSFRASEMRSHSLLVYRRTDIMYCPQIRS